ncbi:hypothetical protein [Paenibacillus sp. FSL R7-0652]|uniref:hypothetical protein n=1 Tax=Paenibacillus sp. FSL R7-0652 TaxID=2921687 RepID=UPI00315ADBF2
MFKRLSVSILATVMLLGSVSNVYAATHTSTATVYGNSTVAGKDGAVINGGNKNAKFTCTASAPSGKQVEGDCQVFELIGTNEIAEVAYFFVDTKNKKESKDVYLASGKKYFVKASYDWLFSDKLSTVTVKATLTYSN